MQKTFIELGNLSAGTTGRTVESTGIPMPDDQSPDDDLAWLIHDVDIEVNPQAGLDASEQAATVSADVGFSTEEDGNPMVTAARRSVAMVRENTANAGADGILEMVDTTDMLPGTIWSAPYLVLFGNNPGDFNGNIGFRAHVMFSVVEVEWRDQLRLWNIVDETDDRAGDWETL